MAANQCVSRELRANCGHPRLKEHQWRPQQLPAHKLMNWEFAAVNLESFEPNLYR
jgi:hypothetical protein